MNRINRVDGARGAAALHRAPHVPSSDVSGGAQTTLRGPITRATQRHTYGPPLSLLVAPAAAAAVLVVVARGARRRLDALLDGGLVVPLVVQLAADLVAENLERLAEQLEVRLGLGRRLGALRVLVGVPLERALLVRALDLDDRGHRGHAEQRVVVGARLLAHFEGRALQRAAHARVVLEGARELLHVLESLRVAAEPVQRVGAREPRALPVVLRVNGDGVRTRAGGPHPYPYPY